MGSQESHITESDYHFHVYLNHLEFHISKVQQVLRLGGRQSETGVPVR